MARKSRKHPTPKPTIQSSRDTVGYIRLSASDEDASGSIRTQQLIIEEWGLQNQTPILHYYIDNGYSGKRFDRPAFQEMMPSLL